MNEVKHTLVTGAAGFIGYHLAKNLCEFGGGQVYLVDNFARGHHDLDFAELALREGVEILSGDLRDSDFVASLPDVDFVYHLASINGTENFYQRPFDVLEAALIPTLALLKRYAQTGIQRFLLSSTSETYSSTVEQFEWVVPTAEDVPLSVSDVRNPRWSYASAKIACESAVNAAYLQFGTPVTTVRYHNVYGPRMGWQHVIPQFFERARRGIFELHGATNSRSFIFVNDAVRLTRLLAQHPQSIGETFHIGTQQEISMMALADLILEKMGIEGSVVSFDAPQGSVSRRVPDTRKLEELTGDHERTALADGLEETLRYYKSVNS